MAAVEHKLGLAEELRLPKIGRFTVLDRVGAGGMGVVYAVYDAALDRRVAVKLIRGGGAPELRERLRREAQALAKLSHPNVVPVFEVGEHEGEAFLAMEFVEGQTLRQWAKEANRDVGEVVEKYVQAGRGLEAAHGAGLVHRDFKPDNAIVGAGGRVRVLDFGLAQHSDHTKSITSELASTRPNQKLPEGSAGFDTPLTQTGALLGTPYYMAPEQLAGTETDHRSDQFSFCVSLWEAICRQRPFPGDQLHDLMEAVAEGTLQDPPAEAKLPARVRAVLERGLCVDPDKRWPSMASLLEALDAGARPSQRFAWLALPAVGLGVAAVAFATGSEQDEPCIGAQQQLAEVWDDGRREAAEGAMKATGVTYAAETWNRTSLALEGYATEWTDMHRDACLATAVRREQSTEVLDLRMGCLHRAKLEMGSVVRLFEDADEKVVARARELVESLPELERCADTDRLRSEVAPPSDEDAPKVDALRVALADAHAARLAGRFDDAQAALESAHEALRQTSYEPAEIEYGHVEGALFKNQGRYDEAEKAYRGVLELATRRLQPGAMRDAAIELMTLVGAEQKRGEEALQSFRMLAEQLSAGDLRSEARVASGLGFVLFSERRYAEAEEQIRLAMKLMTQHRGPDHLEVAHLHEALAQMLMYQGRLDESETEERTALEAFERLLGPEHPRLASSRVTLGNVLFYQGKLDAAEEAYRLALAAQHKALGPNHPALAGSHTGLGMVLDSRGDLASAETEFRRSLEIKETALGPDHPETAQARANLAELLSIRGKYDQAEEQARLALKSYETELGPDHPDVAGQRMGLGRILLKQEQYEAAAAEQRKAIEIFDAKLEPGHPDATLCRTELALALLGLGQHDEALPLAEKAWERRQGEHVAEFDRAQAEYVLARALWAGAADPATDARARKLATSALSVYETAGEQRAKTTDWLRRQLAQ